MDHNGNENVSKDEMGGLNQVNDTVDTARSLINEAFAHLKPEDVEIINYIIDHPMLDDIDSNTESVSNQQTKISAEDTDRDDEAHDGRSFQSYDMLDAETDQDNLADLSNVPEDTSSFVPAFFQCVCFETSIKSSDFIHLPCQCVRCKDCLHTEVKIGLEARKTYPPQCRECYIELEYDCIEAALDDTTKLRWCQIRAEYDDPSPTYCAKCSTYIPRTALIEEGKWGLCSTCNIKTCTACTNLRSKHDADSIECPETIEKASLEEMQKKGYKACPWCKQMIERIEGCDHMSCETCGKNFCYNCGRKKGRSELPCNCQGGHEWVDEDIEECDPEVQQDILDRILNGANRGEIFDAQGFVPGNFHRFGRGRRLGEEGEDLRELNEHNDQADDHDLKDDENSDDRQQNSGQRGAHNFHYRYFPGQGRRIAEVNQNDDHGDNEPAENNNAASDRAPNDGWNHWRARAPNGIPRRYVPHHVFRGARPYA